MQHPEKPYKPYACGGCGGKAGEGENCHNQNGSPRREMGPMKTIDPAHLQVAESPHLNDQ